MFRRFFRWLADVPPSVSSFGRRLDRERDEVFAELDALKSRDENRRGQLLTVSRMVADLKRRLVDVELWLEGVDADDLPTWDGGVPDDDVLDELAPRRLTPPPKEDKHAV
jgi:hypothetical protein